MTQNKTSHWQDLLSQNFKVTQLREGMIGHAINHAVDHAVDHAINHAVDHAINHKMRSLNTETIKNKFVLLGVPDDRGVALNLGHIGSKEGPQEFRNSFYKLYNTQNLGELFIDVGDLKLAKTIEQTHENLAIVVKEILNHGAEMIFVVGGGHDFSYGSYKGHSLWSQEKIIPIFNFDAHLDVRPVEKNEINSGTAFWRILKNLGPRIAGGKALIELGIQRTRNPEKLYEFCSEQKISVVEYEPFVSAMKNISTGHIQKTLEHVRDHFDLCSDLGFKKDQGSVHVSFCLDVLNQFIAPGTSAATPFGLDLSDLTPAFSFFARTKHCRVLDIAELCPQKDLNAQTVRFTAAFVFHFAKMRQEFLSALK